ncbi:hypothetical protein RB195_025047 [Necator americanus]|uniref:Uncharacterized protein n=1 Tax=Necator americanus TaxID=51031 RepID=A0ABR1ESU7_NECAM
MLLNKKCSTDDIDSVAAAEDTVQVTGQKNNAIDYPFEDLLEARVWINVAQMHLCTTAVSQRTLALNRKCSGTYGDWRLRRKVRHHLKLDRKNERTSTAKEFEKAWEDNNPRKAHTLVARLGGVRLSSTLPTELVSTLPIWMEHSNTLLKRRALFFPELVHTQPPTYTVINDEPSTESEVLVCIQRMKGGRSGERRN